MYLRKLFTFAIIFCFAVSGCAVTRTLDSKEDANKSKTELKRGKVTKDELWSEVTRLKQDNAAYKRAIGEKQSEIDQLNNQIADLNKDLKTREKVVAKTRPVEALPSLQVIPPEEKPLLVSEKKAEAPQSMQESKVLTEAEKPVSEKPEVATTPTVEPPPAAQVNPPEEKPAVVSEKKAEVPQSVQESKVSSEAEKTATEKPVSDNKEKAADLENLKVKVLSGDGKISSAKQMVKTLVKLGYRVRITGMAPRSNFAATTVYFAPDYQKEANAMAIQLGGNTISKPLSWPSEFNIIVVTGH